MFRVDASRLAAKVSFSKLLKIALAAGVGLTSAALLYCYWKRRHSPVEDITESYEGVCDPRMELKQKLKLLLQRDNVYCSDPDHVEEVIDSLILGGPSQMQVIADFDHTMTSVTHDGKPVPSTHGVIESCPHLPDWYKDEIDKTRIYYQTIEFNPNMTKEEKIPFMEEWWHKAQEKLTQSAIHRADLEEGVRLSNLYLRKNSEVMLELLHGNDVPLLIFSAGIGNIIEQALLQRYKMYDNIHIIANWIEFNHQGQLVGFKGEPIHTFNKNTHALQNASYFDSLCHRHNVILLGDSLGDLDIADGLIKHENLLTIGYLNKQVQGNLPEYKERYDIVLVHEESADLLNALLENIIATSP